MVIDTDGDLDKCQGIANVVVMGGNIYLLYNINPL